MLRFLTERRFLPAGFQAWLFGTATRVLEAVSGLGLSGYAAVFALAPDEIYAWRIYYKFQDIPEAWTVGVLAAAGLLQTALLFARGVRACVASAYLLLFSGFVWFLVSVAFWGAYPPLNTGMVVPPLLAFFCALAGNNALRFLFSAQKSRGLVDEGS
ncbi:hypothetical protein MZN38_001426 [Neisseria gonorrhoeae]